MIVKVRDRIIRIDIVGMMNKIKKEKILLILTQINGSSALTISLIGMRGSILQSKISPIEHNGIYDAFALQASPVQQTLGRFSEEVEEEPLIDSSEFA